MAEKPILFSGAMVRAILHGEKCQTRRVVTAPPSVKRFGRTAHFDQAFVDPGPSPAGNPGPYLQLPITGGDLGDDRIVDRVYPRWFPGDGLWVREAFAPCDIMTSGNERAELEDIAYRADESALIYRGDGNRAKANTYGWNWGMLKWKPSIFMPRWASRISLTVTSVRVERLQEITEEDARAEGVEETNGHAELGALIGSGPSFREGFAQIWREINGKRPGCSWDQNPWTWAISFTRVDQKARAAE